MFAKHRSHRVDRADELDEAAALQEETRLDDPCVQFYKVNQNITSSHRRISGRRDKMCTAGLVREVERELQACVKIHQIQSKIDRIQVKIDHN